MKRRSYFRPGIVSLETFPGWLISGWELRISHLNVVGMKRPVLHILGFTKFNLRDIRRTHLVRSVDLKRALADFRLVSILSKDVLHKSSNISRHGSPLM